MPASLHDSRSGDVRDDTQHEDIETKGHTPSKTSVPQFQHQKDGAEDIEMSNDQVHPTLSLQPTVSEVTTPPPDGGLLAWSMCACAHIVLADTWGLVNSFGIFQAYYTDYLGISAFQISWIGAIQSFLGLFISIISGQLSDAGHFRFTMFFGTGLLMLGAFTMSFSTTYWQLMLSQGVTVGLGVGFIVCPMMAVASTYFSKKKNMAMGFMTAGNAVGGLIYPGMARQLLPSLGFGWAIRIITFVQLATMIFVLVVARPRVKPKRNASIFVFTTSLDIDFIFYLLASFFAYAGMFTVLNFMVQFSRTGIENGLSYQNSLNLMLIFHGMSLTGRLTSSRLADPYGAVNFVVLATLGCSICCIGWLGVESSAGMYAWVVLFAIPGGSLLSLFPAGAVSLTKDFREVGQRIGMLFVFEAFSALAGPPVAGAIITATNGNFRGAQAYAAALMILAFVFTSLIKVRRHRTGEKWRAKV